jgi:hypothetical protein
MPMADFRDFMFCHGVKVGAWYQFQPVGLVNFATRLLPGDCYKSPIETGNRVNKPARRPPA